MCLLCLCLYVCPYLTDVTGVLLCRPNEALVLLFRYKKNLFQLILPPLSFVFLFYLSYSLSNALTILVCAMMMMNYDVIHLCVRDPTWQPHTHRHTHKKK